MARSWFAQRRQYWTALVAALALVLAVAAPRVLADTATRTSAFDYDPASGLLIKEIIEPGNSELCVVTVYGYDAFGNRTSTTTRNCNGSTGNSPANNSEAASPAAAVRFTERTATSTYDGTDPRLPSVLRNAAGHADQIRYHPRFGSVTSVTDPNGVTANVAYDEFGRKSLEQGPDGNGKVWTYKLCNNNIVGGTEVCTSPPLTGYPVYVVAATPVAGPINLDTGTTGAQNGPWVKTYHDGAGRVIRTETQGWDGSGARTVYVDTEYDVLGQVSRRSKPYYVGDPVYWTSYQYDVLGRMTQVSGPDGSLATTTYSALSTSVTVKTLDSASTNGPALQTTTETRNLVGQVVTVTDALGKTLRRGFDPYGNMVWLADSLGNVTTLAYDGRGRKIALQDPDLGRWSYEYDALGQLLRQVDAKGQATTMVYDVLGRMTQRNEAELVSYWGYDSYRDGSACPKGVGKLCEAATSTGYRRRYGFDGIGRPASTATVIGDATYNSSVSYDAAGRLSVQTYPSGLQLRNDYTTLGFLRQVVNAGSSKVYWSAGSVDAEGHLTQQTYGNGVVTTHAFDPASGRLNSSTASGGVLNLAYGYDYLGNLRSRTDALTGVTGLYDYDALNRLRSETLSGGSLPAPQTSTWAYNEIGNLISRSDLGSYTYAASGWGSVRPHAVVSVAGSVNGVSNPAYAYDANGNMVLGGGRSLSWTSFDMPARVKRGANTLAWQYGPSHERLRETFASLGTQRVTTYLNPPGGAGLFYEEESGTAGTKRKHYINAGGTTVAVAILNGSVWSVQYLHKDHLGSTVAVTNEAGTVMERMAYEPFGKRRYVNGVTDAAGQLAAATTDRGFTGHEMLDEVGLVHMNGRIYDPAVGRFMSADPLVQSPLSQQSFNRYSYGWNNPLSGIDPSGYSWLSKTWKKIWHSSVGRIAVTVAVAYFTGQYVGDELQVSGQAWATETLITDTSCKVVLSTEGIMATGAAGGFAGGFVGSGGNLQTGLEGAVTGAGFGWAGVQGAVGSAERYIAHAAVGCASGAMSGNGCGRGAASAFVAKWATTETDAARWSDEAKFASTVIAGGTVSAVGGGKFENGAVSAAFGYLYNHMLSKEALRDLFGGARGHHSFAKQWANEYRDLISEDALGVLSTSTIGPDVKWEGDHPNRWGAEHKAYNDYGGRKIVEDFFSEKGINANNQLNVKQSYELLDRLNRHEFNVKMQDYVDFQRANGRINFNRAVRPRSGTAQPGD